MDRTHELALIEKQNNPTAKFRVLARNTVMLAPFLTVPAWAQSAGDQLATDAKAQMTGIVTLLVAILVVGIGISVLWFANKNTKKGVSKAG